MINRITRKKSTLFECQGIQHERTNWDTIFTCHRFSVMRVNSFLSYFKTLSIGPAPGRESNPRPPALQ